MDEQRPWHRYLAVGMADLLDRSASVQPESDMSLQQQRLDLLIVRAEGATMPPGLPDGFDDMGKYNLVTFKSHQEALDGRALDELVAHYMAYSKRAGPSPDRPPPESEFRRYAICVRSPRNLGRGVLRRVQKGVYSGRHFSGVLRIVVIHELPLTENNAMLLLFSAKRALVKYGMEHFRQRSPESSSLLTQLITLYRTEGVKMPGILEEFARESREKLLRELTPEERLKGLSPEQIVGALTADDKFKALSPEMRAELARRLTGGGDPPKPA